MFQCKRLWNVQICCQQLPHRLTRNIVCVRACACTCVYVCVRACSTVRGDVHPSFLVRVCTLLSMVNSAWWSTVFSSTPGRWDKETTFCFFFAIACVHPRHITRTYKVRNSTHTCALHTHVRGICERVGGVVCVIVRYIPHTQGICEVSHKRATYHTHTSQIPHTHKVRNSTHTCAYTKTNRPTHPPTHISHEQRKHSSTRVGTYAHPYTVCPLLKSLLPINSLSLSLTHCL